MTLQDQINKIRNETKKIVAESNEMIKSCDELAARNRVEINIK